MRNSIIPRQAMKKDMLRILRCTECKKSGLELLVDGGTQHPPQEIPSVGKLKCRSCGAEYRIENGIAVFVEEDDQTASPLSGDGDKG